MAPPELAQRAIDRLPNRRPASLYDVAVQYSVLDWYRTSVSGDLDFDLAPEHLTFMTPSARSELFGQADNAVVVYVDLSDRSDPKLRQDRPVRVESIGAENRYRLGHSYPANKTSSMTDYSVTTHKSADGHHIAGLRDDAWGTANVQDRFTRWAQSDAAQDVIADESVEDRWIVEAMAELGTDEEAMERVQEAFLEEIGRDQEREFDVFVTVAIRRPDDEDYHLPGEIPALNEVMVRAKADRFENMSVEGAGGEGTGYVTGESTRVLGGSAGLLGMYSKKQREHFADLSPSGQSAWRSRPLTRETAAAVAVANSVFESFFQPLGDGRRLYILPYLGSHPEALSHEEFSWFADEVFERLRSAEGSFRETVNEVFYERESADDEERTRGLFADEESEAYERVRIASAFRVSGNPDRVYFDTVDAARFRPRQLEVAQYDLLRTSPVFNGDGIFARVLEQSGSPLLSTESDLTAMSLFGSYWEWTTAPTRSSEEASGDPRAGDIDDVLARRLRQFLTGERVAPATLVEEYLHHVVQEQRALFSDSSVERGVPDHAIVEQYVQLRAMHDAGVLDEPTGGAIEGTGRHRDHHPTIATVNSIPDADGFASRDERLTDFIERHDLLDGSPERQAVFLLGGLVGRITSYQRAPDQDVSSTLVRRYPIDYLTKQTLTQVTKEVLQMNNTYIEADDQLPSTYNARYVSRLPELMLDEEPTSWSITQNDLQWLYALGIAYGTNDRSIDDEEE